MLEKKPAETQELLLQAARRLIDSQGVNSISMRKIAAECGVSATAVYRHFADKDALLAALLVESFGRFYGYLIASERPRTPHARFRSIAQRYFDFSQECPHDYRLIFMTDGEALGFHRLDDAQVREVNGTFDLLVKRISECQAIGLFKADEPRLVGAHVWAAFHGLASLLLTGSLGVSGSEARDIANYQLTQLERGLFVTPQETPPIRIRVQSRPLGITASSACDSAPRLSPKKSPGSKSRKAKTKS